MTHFQFCAECGQSIREGEQFVYRRTAYRHAGVCDNNFVTRTGERLRRLPYNNAAGQDAIARQQYPTLSLACLEHMLHDPCPRCEHLNADEKAAILADNAERL